MSSMTPVMTWPRGTSEAPVGQATINASCSALALPIDDFARRAPWGARNSTPQAIAVPACEKMRGTRAQ
eukprot:7692660-Alexandrium_andersonii.AAC.1